MRTCQHPASAISQDETTNIATCTDCGAMWGTGATPGIDKPEGDNVSAPTAPSGEVQTYTGAQAALDQYRTQAANVSERASNAKAQCESVHEDGQRLLEALQAAEFGEATMASFGAAVDQLRANVATADQLIALAGDAISASNSAKGHLDKHAGIAAAAAATPDRARDREVYGGRSEN